ncbi:hypothetical protein FT666_15745 [Providencia rettgeri]|uniref:AcrVA2 family anti-CRISPR protein n=1 Tax=Providencia rettgeri TaxID=587 RepID=UPI0011CC007D|nr:hypothetical protein [Providencia rettgeri]TXM53730.1 hypothetical protein FT667_15365 [Providencia rettgeri]TXM77688.1 hypothetical protein FT666_15745 [Providencia rettgeri]
MNDNTTAINIALEKIVLLNKEYKDYLGSCEQEAIDNIKNKNIFMPFYHVMHLCVTKLMNDENWRLIQKDVTARLYLSVTEFIEKNGLDNYGNIDWIKLFRNNYDQKGIPPSSVPTILPWKYTKSVYEMDRDLASELMNSPLPEYIPTEYFKRIPEWSVFLTGFKYIVKASGDLCGCTIIGFWVSLTDLDGIDAVAFTFLFSNKNTSSFNISLNHNNIIDSFNDAAKLTDHRIKSELRDIYVELFKLAIPITTFFIKDFVDIPNSTNPTVSYKNIKKTKGKERLFEAKKIKRTIIGANVGDSIRAFNENLRSTHALGTMRPHIRRAHWHGYWVGTGEGKNFLLKWLPATFINPENSM